MEKVNNTMACDAFCDPGPPRNNAGTGLGAIIGRLVIPQCNLLHRGWACTNGLQRGGQDEIKNPPAGEHRRAGKGGPA